MNKYVPEGVTPLPWRATPHYASNGYGSFSRHPAANRYSNIVQPHPNTDIGCRSFVVSVGIKGDVEEYWLSIKDADARYLVTASNLYPKLCEALEWYASLLRDYVEDGEEDANRSAQIFAANALEADAGNLARALLREAEEAAT